MTDEFVLVRDLPPSIKDDIGQAIAPFTVAFLRENLSGDGSADLVGSGVLVSAGETRAILTAAHVLDAVPEGTRIALMLGQTNQIQSIDRNGAVLIEIAKGNRDANGPDLGIVRLAPIVAGAIASRRAFYNLDKSREEALRRPPDIRDGVWCVQGFLGENTSAVIDAEGREATKFFYNFTGFGGPDVCDVRGAFDYYDFPVSYEARDESPKRWGGMSGGGLWQVPVQRKAGAWSHGRPLLSGVLYYQVATTDTTCGVIGHGRSSVYATAYEAIRGES